MRLRLSALLGCTGLVITGACGGTSSPSSPPAATPSPASTSTARAADAGGPSESTVDTAALDKLTAEEATSGTCDGELKAAMQKVLDEIEANVRAKSEDGEPLHVEYFTKRVMALSEAPKGVQLSLSGKGTEVHVIALAPKEVSLDVLAGTQAASTMRSRFKGEVTAGPAKIVLPKIGAVLLEGDSRQVEMKPGTPLDVKMRGTGCAGVVVFSKS